MTKIPATIITGFLGAGKTTLIRHLLNHANGVRLALIINEFGDLGIDRELLAGCGLGSCSEDDVVELANGCLCCTVAEEFLPTIRQLLGRMNPPDHIVIETSGLALPKPLVQAFRWPEVRSRLTVDGVVAMIDAPAVAAGRFADNVDRIQSTRQMDPALDHEASLQELFEDQLACADLVLLNKADAVDAATLAHVRAGVASRVRPGTKLVPSRFGAIDPRVVLGIGADAEVGIGSLSTHHDDEDHDHDHFISFVADPGPVADPRVLLSKLHAAITAHAVLRVKGFLDVPDKPMRLVLQAVGARIETYYDRPWASDEERRSHLVVIGEKTIDAAAILAAISGAATATAD